jgi:hypothetical protein
MEYQRPSARLEDASLAQPAIQHCSWPETVCHIATGLHALIEPEQSLSMRANAAHSNPSSSYTFASCLQRLTVT